MANNRPPRHVAGEVQPACLICLVDEVIRASDSTGYKPRRVSIGPFYRDESHLMEEEKKNLLYSALGFNHQEAHREQVQSYLENLKLHEGRARDHYHSLFSGMSSDEFVFMLLLDGYFVLYHLGLVRTEAGWTDRQCRGPNQYDRDVIFLLENQLPFFILEEIYKLLGPNSLGNGNNSTVLDTIKGRIKALVHENYYVHETVELMDTDDGYPCHLVHLLYKYFLPANLGSDQNTEDKDPEFTYWRSATYYHAAGVRLAKRNLDGNEARSILDVKLKNGTLQVPSLRVQDNTLTMLRNMVALEQHYPNVGSHVTMYCFFMSKLANTEEDVRLLSRKGILYNDLSRDQYVVDGFANLVKGVHINRDRQEFNYLRPIARGLEKLCHSQWEKSMAWLRHNKCSNIGMGLTVLAGIIGFFCTVEQSSFAGLSYGKQRP